MNSYADKIETRLSLLKIPANVTKGDFFMPSGFIELVIEPVFDQKLNKFPPIDTIIKAQGDIANAIGTNEVRIYQNRKAQICVEVQVSNPEPPSLESLIQSVHSNYDIPMGRGRSGETVSFNLTNPANAHLLISGTTGSGKTALAHAMVLAACELNTPEQLKVAVIDYNNTEADWFYPHIANHTGRIPTNATEATGLLKQIAAKMTSRLPYKLIVFIDELAGICSDSDEALKAIEFITQQGRKYGVHMIAATQKPANTIIGPILKSNMRRVVGRVSSPEDSKVAAGVSGVGCENLAGNGQFIYIDSEFIRFQSALPDGYGILKPSLPSLEGGDILDFSSNEEPAKPIVGITQESVNLAIQGIAAMGKPVTRAAVLNTLGYKQAGGASRKLNEIWDSIPK